VIFGAKRKKIACSLVFSFLFFSFSEKLQWLIPEDILVNEHVVILLHVYTNYLVNYLVQNSCNPAFKGPLPAPKFFVTPFLPSSNVRKVSAAAAAKKMTFPPTTAIDQ
jgi:hypothetical protein